MIKLIIADYDGVIADCKEIHFQSLNKALEIVDPKYVISRQDHISIYDGLSTKKKLNLLVKNKNFPDNKIEQVSQDKQKFTIEMMKTHLSYDEKLFQLLSQLKFEGYKLYLASNAVRETLIVGLTELGVLELFDKIFSNQDVVNQKPHPEIYLKCMVDAGVNPSETLIIEDSKHGREAAVLSGAHVCGVDNSFDLSHKKIKRSIDAVTPSKIKWVGRDVTVLIPMAGAGSRFQREGYKLPKPLIDVAGKPMIQRVVENLNIDGNFVFVVQKEHYELYNLGIILPLISPGCQIVQTEGLTQGAACTTLLAKEFINNDDHLIIANSDQFVEWSSCDFMYSLLSSEVDGGILTFQASDPKWSFAKLNDIGYVTEVAEKNPISDVATVGIYYFNRGREYVQFAEQMIEQDIRVNNEFYVCPIYNEYIKSQKKIRTHNCNKMWGLGIPDDLKYFLKNYEGL